MVVPEKNSGTNPGTKNCTTIFPGTNNSTRKVSGTNGSTRKNSGTNPGTNNSTRKVSGTNRMCSLGVTRICLVDSHTGSFMGV